MRVSSERDDGQKKLLSTVDTTILTIPATDSEEDESGTMRVKSHKDDGQKNVMAIVDVECLSVPSVPLQEQLAAAKKMIALLQEENEKLHRQIAAYQ